MHLQCQSCGRDYAQGYEDNLRSLLGDDRKGVGRSAPSDATLDSEREERWRQEVARWAGGLDRAKIYGPIVCPSCGSAVHGRTLLCLRCDGWPREVVPMSADTRSITKPEARATLARSVEHADAVRRQVESCHRRLAQLNGELLKAEQTEAAAVRAFVLAAGIDTRN